MLRDLESLPRFRDSGLTAEISKNSEAWKSFCMGSSNSYPNSSWNEDLSLWHQLLLHRCLNSEGLVDSALVAASEYLAPECGETLMINIEGAYEVLGSILEKFQLLFTLPYCKNTPLTLQSGTRIPL